MLARRGAAAAQPSTTSCVASGGKLGLTIRAVRLSNPLAGVDVDKAEDHALVEAILAGQSMSDLAIYDMDRTVTRRRDLHAVPAPLRAAPGAVAAAVPAASSLCRCSPTRCG